MCKYYTFSMSGIRRQISGELSQSKKKGKNLEKSIWEEMNPEKISKTVAKTQECKKKSY